jgi:hypothetical protein
MVTPFEGRKDAATINGLRAIDGGAEFLKRHTNRIVRAQSFHAGD